MNNNEKGEELVKSSRQEFYDDMRAYFDAGVLKEIYADGFVCICNASNCMYLGFPYFKAASNGDQILVTFNSKILTAMRRDITKTYVHRLLIAHLEGRLDASKNVGRASEDFLRRLIELKRQTDINGPSDEVDLDLEEDIMRNDTIWGRFVIEKNNQEKAKSSRRPSPDGV